MTSVVTEYRSGLPFRKIGIFPSWVQSFQYGWGLDSLPFFMFLKVHFSATTFKNSSSQFKSKKLAISLTLDFKSYKIHTSNAEI